MDSHLHTDGNIQSTRSVSLLLVFDRFLLKVVISTNQKQASVNANIQICHSPFPLLQGAGIECKITEKFLFFQIFYKEIKYIF